ncbi:hydrolase 2, exosortase A system-associated [Roseateles sp. DC23W]|uniref:Hydrolase 2, exosortase A system-associated n=1 Tax=Pelomonas dachongensis TaxID=3299029 RepID=A0ABW7ETW2_9BURK
MNREIFFLPAGEGEQRLCIFHSPATQTVGRVLYLHPFAEEMNKTRRMASLAARAMAQAGYAVLQMDLRGCGDSSGDFHQASWASWQDDVRLGLTWLDCHAGDSPLWLWSLRASSLLASEAWGRAVNHLFWQPVTSGQLALQQFLRMKMAAELGGGQKKGVVQTLKQQLAGGEAVEVAGYRLSPDLANGLETARLVPAGPAARVEWIDITSRAMGGPSAVVFAPVVQQAMNTWHDAGWRVAARQVVGPSFWASTEIETSPALIDASLEALL